MTKHLEREVERLKKEILSLGAAVEDRVYKAVKAVEERSWDLAQWVVKNDSEIDHQEVEVEEECLKALALHQPVAMDLRFIIAVLKINNDLERIGDLAVNIASRASKLSQLKVTGHPVDFSEMAGKVKLMLRKSLEALVNTDRDIALEVLASDDEVDEINRSMHRIVQESIKKSPDEVEGLLLLISVSRNLERIADHATNIAEDVIYMEEGEIIRHGRGTVMRLPRTTAK